MEAFSLLRYWKGGGGGGAEPAGKASAGGESCGGGATTIVTSVAEDMPDADGGDDEGPFFDLEFAVPDGDEQNEDGSEEDEEEEEEEGEEGGEGEEYRGEREEGEESDGTCGGDEFKFTLSSGSSYDRADPDLPLSPSDDLFFKGQLVAIEPPMSGGGETNSSSKPPVIQFPASFLKSATKFRVLMLKLKKSRLSQGKSEKLETSGGTGEGEKVQQQQKNLFTVKFKIEEVPIVSLFTRDNSSRNSSSSSASASTKKQSGEEPAVSEEKRFMMMQKYLKKVKPLYVRVSRRYGEKMKLSGQSGFGSALSTAKSTGEKAHSGSPETTESAAHAKSQKPVNINIPAGLKVVRKHLGKSRSASSAVPPAQAAPAMSRRRDDSLIEQQDGIQGAILHCKRSFNSSRDPEPSVLARCVSDPSKEKVPLDSSSKSSNESRMAPS